MIKSVLQKKGSIHGVEIKLEAKSQRQEDQWGSYAVIQEWDNNAMERNRPFEKILEVEILKVEMAGLGKLGVGRLKEQKDCRTLGYLVWTMGSVVCWDREWSCPITGGPMRQLTSPRRVISFTSLTLCFLDFWFQTPASSLSLPSGLLPEGASAFDAFLIFPCSRCSLRADTSSQLSILKNQPWRLCT